MSFPRFFLIDSFRSTNIRLSLNIFDYYDYSVRLEYLFPYSVITSLTGCIMTTTVKLAQCAQAPSHSRVNSLLTLSFSSGLSRNENKSRGKGSTVFFLYQITVCSDYLYSAIRNVNGETHIQKCNTNKTEESNDRQ